MIGTTDVMDRLGDDLGEIFTQGLGTLPEAVKRAVLHGLETRRIAILFEITVDMISPPAVQCSACGLGQNSGQNVVLFIRTSKDDYKPTPPVLDSLFN